MRVFLPISSIVILTSCSSCGQVSNEQSMNRNSYNLPGNNIVEFIQDKKDKVFFTDPVDDTVNFKMVVGNIYQDRDKKLYILNVRFVPFSNDRLIYLEYFRDVSDFINLKSYSQLKNGYFINIHKVYTCWTNSDGDFPLEVTKADPKTFIPFDHVAGGKDKNYVYYGGPPDDFVIIPGADPKTVKVLNPARGCWNCGDCYFTDNKSVYYGFNKIEGADPRTFKLLNQDNVDGADKHGKYFEGKLIQ